MQPFVKPKAIVSLSVLAPMHPYIAVPATTALVLRAYWKNSLTTTGIIAAGLTAAVHALHPWSVFFSLLCVFFLGGTYVTKVPLLSRSTVPIDE